MATYPEHNVPLVCDDFPILTRLRMCAFVPISLLGLSASKLLTKTFAKHLRRWHSFRFVYVIFHASEHNFSVERVHAM